MSDDRKALADAPSPPSADDAFRRGAEAMRAARSAESAERGEERGERGEERGERGEERGERGVGGEPRRGRRRGRAPAAQGSNMTIKRERQERGDWNCPHCGLWAFADRMNDTFDYFMSCHCGACGPYCATHQEAIDAWNAMVAPREGVTITEAQRKEIAEAWETVSRETAIYRTDRALMERALHNPSSEVVMSDERKALDDRLEALARGLTDGEDFFADYDSALRHLATIRMSIAALRQPSADDPVLSLDKTVDLQAVINDAFRRGAEAMREAVAKDVSLKRHGSIIPGFYMQIANDIRALSLPTPSPTTPEAT